jgi:two-component system, OmpR family, response regulator
MKTPQKKVLIADDDLDILSIISTEVKAMGFEVVTAESQKEAEKKLETFQPDLAIFDLMMENMDSGFILSYKTKKKYPDAKVIIATAVTSETGMLFGLNTEDEKKWIRADLYMEKSLRPEQLRTEINKLLNL